VEWVDLNGKHLRDIKLQYDNFWRHVETVTRKAARREQGDDLDISLEQHETRCVSVRCVRPRAILCVPTRRNGTQRVDVYLSFALTIRGFKDADDVQLSIVRSNVKLLYVEHQPPPARGAPEPKAAQILSGMHFDFVEQDHHPVFHAQLDDRSLTAEEIKRAVSEPRPRCDTPRIPSGPMDVCGVIYMLLHDHFMDTVVGGWPAELAAQVKALPRLWHQAADERLGGGIDCSWWYPRHTQISRGVQVDESADKKPAAKR
jgi:hypothetical protein